MKLVTTTGGLTERFGDLKSLEIIKNAGFDGYDYALYYIINPDNDLYGTKADDYIKRMKEKSEELNLPCTQAHAPFPSKTDGDMFDGIVKSMKLSAYLGAEAIIVHPICAPGGTYFTCQDEIFKENIKLYKALIPYAEEYGIKVSLENLYGFDKKRNVKMSNTCSHADEYIKYLDELNSEYITACIDIGHCAIVSNNPSDMIRQMGDRIGALHVHDVDYVNDNHTLPYHAKLNWDEICKSIADINYKGDFTFEAGSFYSVYMDDDFIPVATKYMHDVGRSLIKKIESFK